MEESMVSKTFMKVISIGCKVFIATFIAIFAFIAVAAFVSGCIDSGVIGFAGSAAATFIIWLFVELYKEI